MTPAQIVHMMKTMSTKEVFKKYQELSKQLWAGELWNDGYFIGSAGEKVTTDIIPIYIEYQRHEDNSKKLKMFSNSSNL